MTRKRTQCNRKETPRGSEVGREPGPWNTCTCHPAGFRRVSLRSPGPQSHRGQPGGEARVCRLELPRPGDTGRARGSQGQKLWPCSTPIGREPAAEEAASQGPLCLMKNRKGWSAQWGWSMRVNLDRRRPRPPCPPRSSPCVGGGQTQALCQATCLVAVRLEGLNHPRPGTPAWHVVGLPPARISGRKTATWRSSSWSQGWVQARSFSQVRMFLHLKGQGRPGLSSIRAALVASFPGGQQHSCLPAHSHSRLSHLADKCAICVLWYRASAPQRRRRARGPAWQEERRTLTSSEST